MGHTAGVEKCIVFNSVRLLGEERLDNVCRRRCVCFVKRGAALSFLVSRGARYFTVERRVVTGAVGLSIALIFVDFLFFSLFFFKQSLAIYSDATFLLWHWQLCFTKCLESNQLKVVQNSRAQF